MAYQSIKGDFLEEAAPEPSLEGLVEVTQMTNEGQGISGRENSMDKVPEKGKDKVRKRGPESPEREPWLTWS